MKTLIIENTWLLRGLMKFGWGNGYVVIPEGHPMHGKHYDDIDVDVNGGLTFSELITEDLLKDWPTNSGLIKEDIGGWLVGFDTAHCDDSLDKWPKEAVQAETDRLAAQLELITS